MELRPLRPDDFDALYAVAADPLIWEKHPKSDRYEGAVFREFFRDAQASDGALVACDAGDGRMIGSSRYLGYSAERSELEMGWTFLARSHWGGRYNEPATWAAGAFAATGAVLLKLAQRKNENVAPPKT